MSEPTILTVAAEVRDVATRNPHLSTHLDIDDATLVALNDEIDTFRSTNVGYEYHAERGRLIAALVNGKDGNDVEHRAAVVIAAMLAHVNESGGDVADTMWRAQNLYVDEVQR